MSQSCLHDDDIATVDTSLVEGRCESDSDRSLLFAEESSFPEEAQIDMEGK